MKVLISINSGLIEHGVRYPKVKCQIPQLLDYICIPTNPIELSP
jgi:hypothetical protein